VTPVEAFDVVVVGAGPAGSLAARFAAEGGARTLLVDRRTELGEPVQCGEYVPMPEELATIFPFPDVIREAFDVPPETVLRETSTMACIAPGGRRFAFPLRGATVSRRAFDKALAARAEGAGAELRFPAGVARVNDDRVEFVGGGSVSAKVVVGADGPLSTVARSVGFTVPREMYRMITATSAGDFPPEIDLYFGSVAPGGYAWMIPRAHDANVGVGVRYLPEGETLSTLLDRFLVDEGWPAGTDRTRWWVPLGPPPRSAVRGRALFAGDAANLVMATNGGGIPTAMVSGRDAGVAAAAHVRTGAPLAEYDRLWQRHLYEPLRRGFRLKEFGDRFVERDWLLALGMRYIGPEGLDAMMRMKRPRRLGGAS
jgi:digeranylgeranylglycerophospholipid reductase